MSRERGRAYLHLHTQYTPTAVHAKTPQPTDAVHVCTNERVQSGGMAMLTTQKPTFGITWRDKIIEWATFCSGSVCVLFLFFNTDTYTTKLINFGKLSQCLGDNWQCKWQQALASKVFISSALLYSLLSRRLNTVHCTVHSAEESMTWNHEKLLRTAAAGARDLGAACYQVFF